MDSQVSENTDNNTGFLSPYASPGKTYLQRPAFTSSQPEPDITTGGEIQIPTSVGASDMHDKQHRAPGPPQDEATRRRLPRGTRSSSESNQDDLSVHWQKCYNTLSEYDSKIISTWTEEMNTILVFVSSLFLITSRSVLILLS